jgi:2,3-dihydroxy-p-cumate/2,3-dihydroxybenzoate 3,4-dioxygenase
MIRHMVLFRFRPDASDKARAQVLNGLAELPQRFAAMRRFGLGENISKRDSRFTHVMTIEFDTRDQLELYLDSEHHEHFVHNYFRPAIEERAIASYES